MKTDRRALIATAAGAATLGLFGAVSAQATTSASFAALTAVGLDPYITYRKMFGSTADNSECAWWYLGSQPTTVPDVGDVPTGQVATVMAYRIKDQGRDAVQIEWRELGAFRDIASGNPATPWLNPITGQTDMRRATFEDGPARYTVRKSADGVTVSLDQKGAIVKAVTVTATVAGDRVCFTQTEDKTRLLPNAAAAAPIRTTLKIYAAVSDLKGNAANVAARGFYSVLFPDTGQHSVVGLMEKAAMDQKLNPVAWDAMKAAYPTYFTGDRMTPPW